MLLRTRISKACFLIVAMLCIDIAFFVSITLAVTLVDAYKSASSGDYSKAHEIYSIKAKEGSANAQINIGLMYLNGYGVTQDYKEALKWFQLAAKQKLDEAQFVIGYMHENGQGGWIQFASAPLSAWWKTLWGVW